MRTRLLHGAALSLLAAGLGAAPVTTPGKPEVIRHPLRWLVNRIHFELPFSTLAGFFSFEPAISRLPGIETLSSYNPPTETLGSVADFPHPYAAREVDACNFTPPWVFTFREGRLFSARWTSERPVALRDIGLPPQPAARWDAQPGYRLAAWKLTGNRILVAVGWNYERHTAQEFLLVEPDALKALYPALAADRNRESE
jgi:hypothetical protein